MTLEEELAILRHKAEWKQVEDKCRLITMLQIFLWLSMAIIVLGVMAGVG